MRSSQTSCAIACCCSRRWAPSSCSRSRSRTPSARRARVRHRVPLRRPAAQRDVHARVGREASRAMLTLAPYNLFAAPVILVGGAVGGTAAVTCSGARPRCLEWLAPGFTALEGFVVAPAHFVERHGLVVIIAIGESVVAIGFGASASPSTLLVVVACVPRAQRGPVVALLLRRGAGSSARSPKRPPSGARTSPSRASASGTWDSCSGWSRWLQASRKRPVRRTTRSTAGSRPSSPAELRSSLRATSASGGRSGFRGWPAPGRGGPGARHHPARHGDEGDLAGGSPGRDRVRSDRGRRLPSGEGDQQS